MAIKIAAILLVPLYIYIDFGYGGSWQYSSILLSIGTAYDIWYPLYPSIATNNVIMAIGLVVFVSIPGLYFNMWMEKQPREQSLKRVGLVCAIFTQIMPYPLMMFIPYNPMIPSMSYAMLVDSVVPLVAVILIFLPVMGRHGNFMSLDRSTGNYEEKDDHILERFDILPGRYVFLAYILGVIAVVIPSFAMSYTTGWYEYVSISFLSAVWIGAFQANGGAIFYLTIPGSAYSLLLLISGFSLLFAYGVLQYLQTYISGMKLMTYAVLSFIVPIGFFSIIYGGMIMGIIMIPLPVLLTVAAIVAVVLKPVSPKQAIWQDHKVEMWFESPDQQQGQVIGSPVTHHSSGSGVKSVKVPFIYLLMSKIRSLRSPKIPETKAHKTSEADWAETEDIWSDDGPKPE